MRIFCKENKPNTNLVSVPIDDARHSGTILWGALFSMAVGYPESVDEERRVAANAWLDSLGAMFPVESYRCSYAAHKVQYDLYDVASSKQKMVDYFVGLYNKVAENLPHMSQLTSDEVFRRYSTRVVDSSKQVYNSCAA
jgi:hypothetical protein